MSSIKKELYNHSFEDVLSKSDIPENILQLESKRLCKSALEIYRSAQSAYSGGDEELAFIFFMRYINIIKSLQKKPDFRNKQAELRVMLGGTGNINNALDTAEALRKSLIPRFNERDNSRKPPPMKVEALPAISWQNGSNNKTKQPLLISTESQKVPSRGFIS